MKLGAIGWNHGNKMRYDEDAEQWVYADDLTPRDTQPRRACPHCGRLPTAEGHDGCLGELPDVEDACCGHGYVEPARVCFTDGTERLKQDALAWFIAHGVGPYHQQDVPAA